MASAIDLVRRFRELRALVIGDAMLDTYCEGTASRICSEGPVPVVRKTSEYRAPGGAANTAANLRALGAEVHFIGIIGRDVTGDLLRRTLRERGVDDSWLVEDATTATLHKLRVLADGQYVVRLDEDGVAGYSAQARAALLAAIERGFARCDLVVLSDYSYGAVAADVIARLRALREARPCVFVADSKQLHRYPHLGATAITPNLLEARLLGERGTRRTRSEREGREEGSRFTTEGTEETEGREQRATAEDAEDAEGRGGEMGVGARPVSPAGARRAALPTEDGRRRGTEVPAHGDGGLKSERSETVGDGDAASAALDRAPAIHGRDVSLWGASQDDWHAEALWLARAALERVEAEYVALTLSERGALLMDRAGTAVHLAAHPVAHANVAGAGDSFASALALALAAGGSPREAAQIAIDAAGIAVTKRWTATVQHQELLQRVSLRESSNRPAARIPATRDAARQALSRLMARLAAERQAGRRIVFTNGVFDILHAGHVEFLRRAKALGDVLVVGVNSDRSTRRLKGERRPINSERDRLALVAAMDVVDDVVLFDEDTPANLIRALRPHLHVKGGDYASEPLPERDAVREVGAELVILPLIGDLSTSRVIERIVRLASTAPIPHTTDGNGATATLEVGA
ncbi:MAG TPA: D-glycero-beta-D-manno-heptose 1-phosphate adenylyltransferase [Ktedonobacterales bacterium]